MLRYIETDELKEICLEILQAVHGFCEENGIMYSLACGTLIGAIRHKGYIPWDDDIDLYMLRDDYNRFMTIFPQVYNDRYSLVSLERSSQWNCPFAKVFDVRTIMKEDKRTEIDGLGIGIDIFPIDNAPDSEIRWRKYERKRRLLRNIYVMKELRWRKNRSLLKNLLVQVCSVPLNFVSARFLAFKMNAYSQKFNSEDSNYYAENSYGEPYNERFSKQAFSKTIDWVFENRMFKVMIGYDEYLRNFYGDYMKLPPLEAQISHHHFMAYWK